jgi:peptidyl-tRNA hydrolase, PTH1 family
MRLFRGRGNRPAVPADFLIVGLGNPGSKYARTRHNVGFEVADALIERWGLPKPRKAFGGLVTEGRTGPGGPRVAVLLPQTYMNDSGRAAGPARGQYGVPLDRVVAIHDEIDLPFGQIQARMGGGLAGHNGLKSLKQHLGGADFMRVRVGVGRPDTTDPEIVSRHVLSRFDESPADVRALIDRAAAETERLVTSKDASEAARTPASTPAAEIE